MVTGTRFATDVRMEDTTKTGEAWRDEFCPACSAVRQYEREADGEWRCGICHTLATPHTARRLDGAESNYRKQSRVTESI
jgi:ribosomal protein L37AE/L43A